MFHFVKKNKTKIITYNLKHGHFLCFALCEPKGEPCAVNRNCYNTKINMCYNRK